MSNRRTAIPALASALALTGFTLAGAAHAADSTTVNVTATVNANCNMQAASTPVAFGSFSAFSGATATGQVTLQCNKGATVRVDINNGNNFGAGQDATLRAMKSGSDYISYHLYQPNLSSGGPGSCGGTTAWGSGAGAGLSATSLYSASGGSNAINICGVVDTPGSSGYAVGTSYTDTVTVTAVYN